MDSSHPDWCVMVPHCGFDLDFSDNEWCSDICMSSLEKCLFSYLAHFFTASFIFLELSWRSCLYIFEISPLSVASFAMFSQLYNLVGLTVPQHPIHGQQLWSHISWYLLVRCSVPFSIKGAFPRGVEFFCRGHGITSVSQGAMLRPMGLARGNALMWHHRTYQAIWPQ